ncbi:formylmethanofuran--tetrahydromethanopterin N-formyltransferase [Rubripirellula amarantea]|uniref:Formylmethanofuran--tetrahydromethanopterin formyltransferase n=1 Tax=Rubripirellula amarantea TaxID=2527999 RepID=A0A5C5WYL5_9BACT|nr:formylmethanofuran--tetrahydromethanopterin N-formyltransferase [Rubripirellula amarantea]MDA8745644.1 formylmethanofuran--tetrahydromethanopterin N-formyltransferase [Rubripirellula amarantea]TWT55171.1 Formyltransferase/hydrolase complex subunit D [Rubripirellula amarantea]
MSESKRNPTLQIAGVEIEDEFAEAFDMKATRVIITAHDERWAAEAAAAMTGFGTSVIACGIETAVEKTLSPDETPDGRPGVSILAFAVSGSELEKQIPRRVGQCVLTCPTTAIYAGIDVPDGVAAKRVPIGKMVRFFGDGNQISKVVGTEKGPRRFWRVPVMDGEFVCEHDVARVDGIGGGNFLLLGRSLDAITIACRAACDAMKGVDGVITPFPGGAARSGSKVGSKYSKLFASTNDAFCPTLRKVGPTLLRDEEDAALEIVIDGMSFEAIAESMKVGITAACRAGADAGLLRVTAGNYGGKLGKHHFRLHEVMS